MKEKKFQKNKEDFVCEFCGEKVYGNGYTDHCTNCLWSKHLDVNPGDRKETCRGMMMPVGVEKRGSDYIIFYKCQKCGYLHNVKMAKDDNFEEVIKISKQQFL